MSQVKVKHPFSVLKYFVFNTDWGNREGWEHEKLIYYYSSSPPTSSVTMDQKVSDIGLAEATINFSQQFGDIAESLHGNRMRFVLLDLSPSIWCALCISEPYSVHKSNDDNVQITEYHEHDISNVFLKLKLSNIYQYFQLLNGPIERLCAENERETFLEKCQSFFDNYIPHLELIPFNLIELYSSIQYLPLDNITFMSVQSLLNCLQAIDSGLVRGSMFLYNNELVSSSLSLEDTKIVYNYVTNNVLPDVVKEEINGVQQSKTRWLQTDLRVYLSKDKSFYTLCLFRSINGSTICLILDRYDENTLQECEALLSSRLITLTNKLHETVTQIIKQMDTKLNNDSFSRDIKFIYMNQSNRAQRGSPNCRKLVDCDFTRLVIDVDHDMSQLSDHNQVFELVAKNTNDSWLVARGADFRSLFTILNYKNANVIEATEMVNSLQNIHLKDIFFGV